MTANEPDRQAQAPRSRAMKLACQRNSMSRGKRRSFYLHFARWNGENQPLVRKWRPFRDGLARERETFQFRP